MKRTDGIGVQGSSTFLALLKVYLAQTAMLVETRMLRSIDFTSGKANSSRIDDSDKSPVKIENHAIYGLPSFHFPRKSMELSKELNSCPISASCYHLIDTVSAVSLVADILRSEINLFSI
jgi:hypothetical protein